MEKAAFVELRKINNLLARESSKTTKDFPESRLTEMHANIMRYLLKAGEEGVLQKDIEQVFTIRKSTASRILKLMEANGFIERRGVDYDARLKRIFLTPSAWEHSEIMRIEGEKMERRIRTGISEEDMKTFFKVLSQMEKNLDQ